MRGVIALLFLIILVAGCVENTGTTTSSTETSTTTSTSTTEITATITTTTVLSSTTTMVSLEQGIDITNAESGKIYVKNLGKVKYILASDIDLYINGQIIEDPQWTFTIIYPTNTMNSRVSCNEGDEIRVVGPVNEDSDVCSG